MSHRAALLALLPLLACTEYGIETKDDASGGDPVDSAVEDAPTLLPSLSVDPEAVALGPVCGQGGAEVTLSNVGEAALTITALTPSTPTWTVVDPGLPLEIPAGEAALVELVGAPGEATLTIRSDDPERPEWELPLSASEDGPPEVTILSPSPDVVVDVDADLTLLGQLWDDATAPEALEILWSSDVDGQVSVEPAGADGLSQLTWVREDRSAGPQTLTLDATDACGNTASDSVSLCQQEGWTEENLDLSSWNFEGAALWDSSNGWVELTDTGNSLVGSAFETSHSVSADAVTIEFSFFMGGGTGADGFAVTALDTTRMTSYLGSSGGCLGYGSGSGCGAGAPLPGWTIEVDTYANAWDPTGDDHLAFMFDGDVDTVEAWVSLPEMEDTGWHQMAVTVAAPDVKVVIDGVTYLDQAIAGHYSFPAHVGFTAATGGSTNYHLIDALEVTEVACEED